MSLTIEANWDAFLAQYAVWTKALFKAELLARGIVLTTAENHALRWQDLKDRLKVKVDSDFLLIPHIPVVVALTIEANLIARLAKYPVWTKAFYQAELLLLGVTLSPAVFRKARLSEMHDQFKAKVDADFLLLHPVLPAVPTLPAIVPVVPVIVPVLPAIVPLLPAIVPVLPVIVPVTTAAAAASITAGAAVGWAGMLNDQLASDHYRSLVTASAILFQPSITPTTQLGRICDSATILPRSAVVIGDLVLASDYGGALPLSSDILSVHDIFVYITRVITAGVLTLQYVGLLPGASAASLGQVLAPPQSFNCLSATFLVARANFRSLLLRQFPAAIIASTPVTTSNGDPWSSSSALSQHLATALTDQASRKSTPAGNQVSLSAATVLSTAPELIRAKGNLHIWYMLSQLTRDHETLRFWRLFQWRTQLQPAHLLLLMRSWADVDVWRFSCLLDHYNRQQAREITDQLQRGQDEVDPSLPCDSSILGLCLSNFKNGVMGYCVALDGIFAFKEPIKLAIRDAADRIIDIADRFRDAVATTSTAELFSYLLQHFVTQLNQAYRAVLGCSPSEISSSTDTFLSSVAAIPDVTQHSEFTLDLAVLRARNHSLPTPQLQSAPKRQRLNKPVTAPATPPLLCGFHNSKRKDKTTNKFIVGCNKPNCARPHRAPTTAADAAYMADFFIRFPRQQPR